MLSQFRTYGVFVPGGAQQCKGTAQPGAGGGACDAIDTDRRPTCDRIWTLSSFLCSLSLSISLSLSPSLPRL